MPPPNLLPSGLQRVGIPVPPALGPTKVIIGKVTFIECYAQTTFLGCFAAVSLKDDPASTAIVFTPEQRLQSLLQMSFATGTMCGCAGQKFANPPAPEGFVWPAGSVVYNLFGVFMPPP